VVALIGVAQLDAAMLKGLAKSRQRLSSAVRNYASAELAVADQTPFLKFATPVPQAYNHLQALGSIPETKVGSSSVVTHWSLDLT
jgi:hypothetical protein